MTDAFSDDGHRRLEPEAVSTLYATHARDVQAFLIGLLRDRHLAEEATQNTFGKALTHGGDVDPQSWKAWLFQVAYNEAMGLRRRRQMESRHLRQIASSRPSYGVAVDGTLVTQEELDRLRAAIDRLPVDQQTVVLRRIQQEQTFQQIADELALPLGTVLTRMRLALSKLRRALVDDER